MHNKKCAIVLKISLKNNTREECQNFTFSDLHPGLNLDENFEPTMELVTIIGDLNLQIKKNNQVIPSVTY